MSDTVTVRPIRSREDFDATIRRISEIWGAKEGTPERDEWNILCTLAAEWERKNDPVPPGDAVDAVLHAMDRLDLQAKDLVPYFGAQSRVSDFLRRRRGLSITQIRRLHKGLKIPLELLVGETEEAAA